MYSTLSFYSGWFLLPNFKKIILFGVRQQKKYLLQGNSSIWLSTVDQNIIICSRSYTIIILVIIYPESTYLFYLYKIGRITHRRE